MTATSPLHSPALRRLLAATLLGFTILGGKGADTSTDSLIDDFESKDLSSWKVAGASSSISIIEDSDPANVKDGVGSGKIVARYVSYGALTKAISLPFSDQELMSLAVSFWLKTDAVGQRFQLTFHQKDGGLWSVQDISAEHSGWQLVEIPLSKFTWNKYAGQNPETDTALAPAKIDSISFEVFPAYEIDDKPKTFWLDDLKVSLR